MLFPIFELKKLILNNLNLFIHILKSCHTKLMMTPLFVCKAMHSARHQSFKWWHGCYAFSHVSSITFTNIIGTNNSNIIINNTIISLFFILICNISPAWRTNLISILVNPLFTNFGETHLVKGAIVDFVWRLDHFRLLLLKINFKVMHKFRNKVAYGYW